MGSNNAIFVHFRAHFDYDQPIKGEMSFRKGDIFHVTDTLHNNVVGSWQVYRIGENRFERIRYLRIFCDTTDKKKIMTSVRNRDEHADLQF